MLRYVNNPLIYTDPTGEIFDPISTIFLFFTDAGYKIQKWISPVAVKGSFLPFGSNQAGIGIDASIGIPQVTPISFRVHGGVSYYWKNEDLLGNDLSGWETRRGAEAGIQSYLFAGLAPPGLITISGTTYISKWSGKQTTNLITVGGPFINMQYENDMKPEGIMNYIIPLGIPKGDGDRYRTAAAQIKLGPFSIGTNMITGDAGPDRHLYTQDVEGGTIYLANDDYDPDKYRFGTFYFGVGPVRIGRNSENIRHVLQNKFAHDIMTGGETKWFKQLPLRPRWYWWFGFGSGGTLW